MSEVVTLHTARSRVPFLVDAADAEAMSYYTWGIDRKGNVRTWIGKRDRSQGPGAPITLQRTAAVFLMGKPPNGAYSWGHINGDRLDNRRANFVPINRPVWVRGEVLPCVECKHSHPVSSRGRYRSNVKYRCGRICAACKKEYSRQHRGTHPERYRKASGISAKKLKAEMIAAYGGSCECCGESGQAFLTLEHRLGNGAQERKSKSNATIMNRLRAAGWPKTEHGLLCFNCNIASYHNGGVCPHGGYKWATSVAS